MNNNYQNNISESESPTQSPYLKSVARSLRMSVNNQSDRKGSEIGSPHFMTMGRLKQNRSKNSLIVIKAVNYSHIEGTQSQDPEAEQSRSPQIKIADFSEIRVKKRGELTLKQGFRSKSTRNPQPISLYVIESQPKETITYKREPISKIYYAKIEINELELRVILESCCKLVIELRSKIQNNKTVYRSLIKSMMPEMQTLALIFTDTEKKDLLDSYTYTKLQQRIFNKSVLIFQSLSLDTQQPFFRGKKVGQCFREMLAMFHQRLMKLSLKRQEWNIEIMRQKIINEMTAVHYLKTKRYETHLLKQASNVNVGSLIQPKLQSLAIDVLESESPANRILDFESTYGRFPKVSSSERVFHDQINGIIKVAKRFRTQMNEEN